MRVSDVMTSPAITVEPSTPLSDVIPLMLRNKLSGVPVVDPNGQIVGVLSEGDLLRRVELGTASVKKGWWYRLFTSHSPAETYRRANGRKVSDVMTTNAVTVESTDTLVDAARLMQGFRVKRLPVTNEGILVGMLTRTDFMKALSRFLAPAYEEPVTSDGEIKDRIEAEITHQGWSTNCTITINCDTGKVTLTGYVPSGDHKSAIVVAAENVVGVLSVDNRLEVLAPMPMIRI